MKAAEEYIRRKARHTHPNGELDKKRRWYPSDEERQECCRQIRRPSARFPYSYMTHCRTVEHVAKLHGVSPEEVRLALKVDDTEKLRACLITQRATGRKLDKRQRDRIGGAV